MSTLSWASHRTLALNHRDIAVLADHSSGWCVLEQSDYRRLCNVLPTKGELAGETLTRLWDAGLLLRDGEANPVGVFKPSPYPTALLLKLTGTCNIECDYCYDYDSKRFKTQQTLERIEKTIDFLISKNHKFSVVFHGGEPLLRFDLLKQTVALLEPYQDRVAFSVQTNGTRFTPEIIGFLEAHNFSVGLSLDGSDEASNVLRKVQRGPTPLESVKRLLQDYPEFVRERCGFLAVASRTSVPGLPDFALWLQEQGIKGLAITFLDLVGRGAGLVGERLSPDEAVALYERLIDLIRSGQLRDLALRNLLGRMHNLFTLQSRDLCYRGPCGASGDFLVLDAGGTLRTCDCIYHPYFELGDLDALPVANHSARQAIETRHAWLRDTGATCATCPLFGVCGGTCVAKALVHHGHDKAVDPVECALSQYLYPTLFQEFVAAEKPLFAYYAYHEQRPFDYPVTV